jgi:hypothetical protein
MFIQFATLAGLPPRLRRRSRISASPPANSNSAAVQAFDLLDAVA